MRKISDTEPTHARRRALLLAPLAILAALTCSDAPAGPADRVEEVDLAELFAPPTEAETAAVEAEWRARDVSSRDARIERSESLSVGGEGATLHVLSHTVDGSRHYGAVLLPEGFQPGELPVLVYAHGGDRGFSVEELLLVAGTIHAGGGRFVYVAPSFRSEPLNHPSETFVSEGSASPWDRDVDDALALLNTALETVPEADATRIGVLGLSRGGGVALLMGIRDPRIDRVVEFFGPTDFFDAYVQEVVEESLNGSNRPLPGLTHMDSTFIQPLSNGLLEVSEVRIELVRRSAVLFAERLPPVQAHHGEADPVVSVSQAVRLAEAMTSAGRTPPEYEVFIYADAGHDFNGMPRALIRAVDFLEDLE